MLRSCCHELARVSAKPAIEVNGVRNSWLTMATKSFLMCRASSASWRASSSLARA